MGGLLRRTRRMFFIVFIGIVIQYFVVYIIWRNFCQCPLQQFHLWNSGGDVIAVVRDFNPEYNDLPTTIRSLAAQQFVHKIVLVSDRKLYPPLSMPKENRLVHLELLPDVSGRLWLTNVRELFTAKWLILLPDAVTVDNPQFDMQEYVAEARRHEEIRIWGFKVRGKRVSCHSVALDHKRWTLHVNSSAGPICDAFTGSVVYLIRTGDFLSLVEPFAQPVDDSLLVQSAARGWKMKLFEQTPFSRSKVLLDPQVLAQQRSTRDEHLVALRERFGIKRTITNGHEELFGCSKTTPRCFGNIINETPSYMYEHRWTPPCCVRALRRTLQHVVEVFNLNGVRYWLEGGSLLGAARNGELIPWDYDIDLGMYLNDTIKVQFLEAAKQGPVSDPEGFVWEMSQPEEGQFFRVHYSRVNRMHVDIFPFYSNSSIMTKDFWFTTHPQDREFPESFLTPIESVSFMGLDVSAPNSIREFLELKFGVSCIENPKHPGTDVV